jgi:arylsulfatase A-like enzyme
MQRWGYQTALFGKYLNGFVANHPRIRERVYVEATASVPAGWGTFETRDANNIDGLRTQALDWLRTNPTGPVFLYVAPVAPHVDYQFPDRYADAYSDEPEPERSRLRECRAVDDLTAALANRLNTQGRLRRTILVVVSDNGFHSFCEHGDCDKGKPYKESLRVTIRALGPSVPQGKRDVLVCPQDIPVTIAALAGAELNGTDGINFLTESRPYRLIQYYYPGVEWAGLAGPDWTYVEWSDGRRTFWDLARDPSENIDYHPDLPPERQTLLAQMLAAERGARENS